MDTLNHTLIRGANISTNDVYSWIPENLELFFLQYSKGVRIHVIALTMSDKMRVMKPTMIPPLKVMSVAQDFIYDVSGGKLWTPKHVRLGCSLHHATSSKQLVHLFHRAGYTIRYKIVLQLDITMAKETLKSLDRKTGGILPANFVPHRSRSHLMCCMDSFNHFYRHYLC